jgi:hypothetical protein
LREFKSGPAQGLLEDAGTVFAGALEMGLLSPSWKQFTTIGQLFSLICEFTYNLRPISNSDDLLFRLLSYRQ